MRSLAKTLYLSYQDGSPTKRDYSEFLLERASSQKNAQPLAVFTTLVARNMRGTPALCALDYHIERLFNNAKAIAIHNPTLIEHRANWVKETILSIVRQYVLPDNILECDLRVRLILTTIGFETTIEHLDPIWPGDFSAKLASLKAQRPHPLQKTTAVKVSREAREEAERLGADEALLLNDAGEVLEGAWSNIFWFDAGGTLFTTKSNILHGVSRRIILENAPCKQIDISLEALKKEAKEIFLTQSTSGITLVGTLDEVTLEGRDNTKKLQSKFDDWLAAVSVSIIDR